MKRSPLRIVGLVLATASFIGLVVSVVGMTRRLADREDLTERPVAWFAEPVLDAEFAFAGNDALVSIVESPPPTIEEAAADPSMHLFPWPGAERHLTIEWRGNTVVLPIVGEDRPPYPGLMRFEDWFRIAPMAVAQASSNREVIAMLERGLIEPRLVIAARYPAEGFDPESWGLVRRQDWPYVFVELHAGGDDADAVSMHRATYRELEDLFAPGPRAKPIELSPEERDERFWQHSAMLQVTPSVLYRARDKQVEAGMRAMGWTWPAAGVSVLGLIVGVGLVFMGSVRRW